MFRILRAIIDIFGSADEFRTTKERMSDKDFREAQTTILDIDRSIKEKDYRTKEYYNPNKGKRS